MKTVLLSGGSGTRLWPLSNDSRSKQFLRVLRDQNGGLESMVQRVTRQLLDLNEKNEIYIATNKAQVEIIQSQIGNEVSLVIEPEKRDTFPAIALVATYLYSVVGVSLDEVVCVLPVDPYVEDAFFQTISTLEEVIHHSDAELALLGVKPTYPSEKYGYIVPKEGSEPSSAKNYLEVSHFTEKPNEEKAKQLIEQNAYWNCGVFAFKLKTIINKLEKMKAPINYEQLSKQYKKLKKTSFDYEVVEQTRNVVFVPYEGSWKDLGTWNTLTDEIDSSLIGKGFISDDSVNTHLINELEIPVAILGLPNVVVAASPDGILVSEKKSSPRVKEAVHCFEQMPMYEEKQWGSIKILDYVEDENEKVITKRVFIKKDNNINYQFHHTQRQIWTILTGEGTLFLDGMLRPIVKGDVIEIVNGSKYAIRATEDLEIIEVQFGKKTMTEEETVFLSSNWDEMVENYKGIKQA